MNIQEYLKQKEAQGLAFETLRAYKKVLTALNTFKDVDTITKTDLTAFFNTHKWTSDNTRNLYIILIKAFFTDNQKADMVEWMKLKKAKETLKSDDILDINDVNKLIETADSHYWKALIAFLYESGCRIGEAKLIKWKDIQDTTDGIIVNIPTKKTAAGFRKVILPFASQYLKNLQIYNYAKPDDFIFFLSYRHTADTITEIAEKAGIKKPVTAHKFRHAQATELVREGMQEAIIRKKLGWAANSGMIARYQHLNDDDVINATLEKSGKITERNHKPAEIKQPEKVTITEAAGRLFQLEEENEELKEQLKQQQEQNDFIMKALKDKGIL